MELHMQPTGDALSRELAEWITDDIETRLAAAGRYSLVLSGGSTPEKLYRLLATEPYLSRIDWEKMHLFWGDERYVPFEDERNNGRMAYEALIRHTTTPADQVHYMDTAMPAEASAQAYADLLRRYFGEGEPAFDLVLLGMGDDGHTLSLFPGSTLIDEQKAWVAAPFVPAQDMYRITLTAPIVNLSRHVAFLVTGEKKATVLQAVVRGPYQPKTLPSQLIRPAEGALHFFVDEAAGRLLS